MCGLLCLFQPLSCECKINVWAAAVLLRGACNCLPVRAVSVNLMCGLLQSFLEVHAIAYQC